MKMHTHFFFHILFRVCVATEKSFSFFLALEHHLLSFSSLDTAWNYAEWKKAVHARDVQNFVLVMSLLLQAAVLALGNNSVAIV